MEDPIQLNLESDTYLWSLAAQHMSTRYTQKHAKILRVKPVSKPRMTQRDRWKKRPVVEAYWDYKNKLIAYREENGAILSEAGDHIVFLLPMPKSWSKKRKLESPGRPHQQRPDLDNLLKGIWDGLLEEDSMQYDVHATKIWSPVPAIIVAKEVESLA